MKWTWPLLFFVLLPKVRGLCLPEDGCRFKRLARMGKRTKCMTTSPVSFAKFVSGTWVSSLHGLWVLHFNIHRWWDTRELWDVQTVPIPSNSSAELTLCRETAVQAGHLDRATFGAQPIYIYIVAVVASWNMHALSCEESNGVLILFVQWKQFNLRLNRGWNVLYLRYANSNLAMPKSMKILKAWNEFICAFRCPRCQEASWKSGVRKVMPHIEWSRPLALRCSYFSIFAWVPRAVVLL